MPLKKRNTWVIYPEYFDVELSRSEGRRVPKKYAVSSPDIAEISKILKNFDIPNMKEDHKAHPSTWYKKDGRIIINKQKISKQKFLKQLSKRLKKERRK
ncbi:MAG: signal recognition particle subunit SRP19/SEC65 family protein [Candidatus Saliniplasma sp.]